jgi:hypothetical protein
VYHPPEDEAVFSADKLAALNGLLLAMVKLVSGNALAVGLNR